MKKEKRSKMSGIWFFQRIRRKLVELEYDNVLIDNSSEFMNVIICLKQNEKEPKRKRQNTMGFLCHDDMDAWGVPLVPDHPNCSDPVRSNIELTLTNLQLKSVTGLLPLDTINSWGLGGHRGILCSGDLCLS